MPGRWRGDASAPSAGLSMTFKIDSGQSLTQARPQRLARLEAKNHTLAGRSARRRMNYGYQ